MAAVIERIIVAVACSCEKQPLLVGIFGDGPHVSQRMLGQAVGNPCPSFSEIRCFVDERIAIVDEMKIYGSISRGGFGGGGLDSRHRTPKREILYIFRDVGPVGAGVSGTPNLAVTGAGPNEPLLELPRGDGEKELS